MEIKPCEWCKKEFRAGARKNGGRARFCSIACSYAQRMANKITKVCSWCGRSYSVSPLRATVSTCCSKSCYRNSKWSIQVTCSQCGTIFLRRKDSSAIEGVHKDMCRACVNSQKGKPGRPPRTGIMMACKNCGKDFYAKKHRVTTAKFCSRKCNGQYILTHGFSLIERTCASCGQIFKDREMNRKKFCSDACKGEWAAKRGFTAMCIACGKVFQTGVLNKDRAKFCSPGCQRRGTARKRGRIYRTFMREEGRMKFCESCGWKLHPEVLQVDHKDGDPRNDVPENLQVLCPNCHAWETYQRREAKREANLAKVQH